MTNTNTRAPFQNAQTARCRCGRGRLCTRQPCRTSFLYFLPHNGVYCPGAAALIAQSRVPPTGDDELASQNKCAAFGSDITPPSTRERTDFDSLREKRQVKLAEVAQSRRTVCALFRCCVVCLKWRVGDRVFLFCFLFIFLVFCLQWIVSASWPRTSSLPCFGETRYLS